MYALERGGTCTGEHGVGIGKQKYQKQEHGAALLVMEKIKKALDPNNLLNPDKIVKFEYSRKSVQSLGLGTLFTVRDKIEKKSLESIVC